jgi:hypothetical protein
MSRESGGVFIQIRVGSPGNSSSHVRYISRPAAVRDGREGVLLHNLPEAEKEISYMALRDYLVTYAWLQERLEQKRGAGRRTFYHTKSSFEREVETSKALNLVKQWLSSVFPQARGAAFLHRDTNHLHLHIWLEARGTDGRKLQMGYRTYRSLDEEWSRLYCLALGRSPDEHRLKKEETRQALREGLPLPERRNELHGRDWYRAQELRNAGGYEPEKGGIRGDEPATTDRTPQLERGEYAASAGEPTPASCAGNRDQRERGAEEAMGQSLAAAKQAVSEARQLREDAQRLAEREAERAEERERQLTRTGEEYDRDR